MDVFAFPACNKSHRLLPKPLRASSCSMLRKEDKRESWNVPSYGAHWGIEPTSTSRKPSLLLPHATATALCSALQPPIKRYYMYLSHNALTFATHALFYIGVPKHVSPQIQPAISAYFERVSLQASYFMQLSPFPVSVREKYCMDMPCH